MYYRHFYGSFSAGWLDVVRHPSPFTRNPPPHSPERFFPVPHSLHCVCLVACCSVCLYNSCRSREAEAPTSAMNESAPKSFYSWDREWSWGWWWRIPLKILYPNVSVFGFFGKFQVQGDEERRDNRFGMKVKPQFVFISQWMDGLECPFYILDGMGVLWCAELFIYILRVKRQTDRQIADCLTRRRSS